MYRVVRILCEDTTSLPESLIAVLNDQLMPESIEVIGSGFSYDNTDFADEQIPSLNLLYVRSNHSLNHSLASNWVAQMKVGDFGVYLEDAGPVIMQGGAPVFRRFLYDRESRHDIPVYQTGGALRSNWKITKEDVPLPKQVYLGLTQICNRSCLFCVSRTFETAMLSLDTVRQLARKLRDHVEVVALTGAGEAMVHPEFWPAVEILMEEIPNVRFKINSSGVTVGKFAERIVQYPFRNLTISLNAATPETYRRFIGGDFEQVQSSIRKLVSVRAQYGAPHQLGLTLSIVLMNSTMAELPDFVSRAFELGVEEVQGIYLMINDAELESESPWHHPQRANELFDKALERAASLGIAMRLPPRFQDREKVSHDFQASSLPETQGQACVEAWSTIYVRPNGEILPCPYSEEALGNIHHAQLDEIWNGSGYNTLRETLVEKRYQHMCRHCCGFNETGHVDDYLSHWLGARQPDASKSRALPLLKG
jgi:radical SAM protein with 4Fe4S-binding SPASM domain